VASNHPSFTLVLILIPSLSAICLRAIHFFFLQPINKQTTHNYSLPSQLHKTRWQTPLSNARVRFSQSLEPNPTHHDPVINYGCPSTPTHSVKHTSSSLDQVMIFSTVASTTRGWVTRSKNVW
jgi:hypothetical protein